MGGHHRKTSKSENNDHLKGPLVMGYDAWDVEEVDETEIEEENIDLYHEHEDSFKFLLDEVINNCRFHEAMSYIRQSH